MTADGRSRAAVCGTVCAVTLFAAGCGYLASADDTQTLEFGGLTRTYTVHATDGRTSCQGLVVNLHGRGSTGQQQRALTHYDAVADAHGFVVVYPDGVGRSWADGRGVTRADQRGVDDVGFLTALVDRLVDRYGVEPGRVFVTGFSNGAFMTNRLACDRADRVAAVAPVAGTLGAQVPCAPSRPVAVLTTHGTADPFVPFGGDGIVAATDMAARWRGLDGCPGEPVADRLPDSGDGTAVTRYTSTGCAAGSAVTFMRVDGGGHTWPGGPQYLPEAVIGPTTTAFDAAQASGEFFVAHARKE